jgi:hypothetical protein
LSILSSLIRKKNVGATLFSLTGSPRLPQTTASTLSCCFLFQSASSAALKNRPLTLLITGSARLNRTRPDAPGTAGSNQPKFLESVPA